PYRSGGRLADRARRRAGRHRQQQYRRHAAAGTAGAYEAARCRHLDLRTYDGPRPAARPGLPLLRGATQGARHGNLPGPRLRGARLSKNGREPVGDDGVVGDRVDPRMNDRTVDLGIFDARARAAADGHEQAAIDLLPPVHPRGIFLPHEAALGEADAVKLRSVAFEPKEIGEFPPSLANAKVQAMLEPADRGLVRRREPALSERGEPRVGNALVAVLRPVHRERASPFDHELAPEPIDRQALDEIVRGFLFAIEKQVLTVVPDDEIEQAFALGREQSRPHRQRPRDVAGDETLHEDPRVVA